MSTIEIPTVAAIETQAHELVLEARTSSFDWGKLRRVLPDFFTSIKTFATDTLERISGQTEVGFVNHPSLGTVAKNSDYVALRRVPVMVPKGLDTDYLTYLSHLSNLQDMHDTLVGDVLVPFERYLAQMLDDPTQLNTKRRDALFIRLAERPLDDYKDQLRKDFSKTNHETASYGKLVRRHADWPTIAKQYDELATRYNRINPSDVLEMVTTISDHLNVLVERVEEDQDTYRLSGITTSSLAQLCYQMAVEVEQYGLQGYLLQTLETSLKAAQDLMKSRAQ